MVCSKCNHQNEGAGKFCANCGAALAVTLTCPTCGKIYPAGTKFCTEDGAKLGAVELPPTCPTCGKTYPIGTKFCHEDGTNLSATAQSAPKPPVQSAPPPPAPQKPDKPWIDCPDSDTKWYFEAGSGTLTIGGEGDMPDFYNKTEMPWHKHKAGIKKLIVEDGVTSIGSWAFFEFENLKSVTIPDSVEQINDRAFVKCGISEISCHAEIIGDCAFSDCSNLTKIKLEQAENVGDNAFGGCKSLTEVKMDKVVKIKDCAFSFCENLKRASFIGVKEIGEEVFNWCSSLRSLTLRKNVKMSEELGMDVPDDLNITYR